MNECQKKIEYDCVDLFTEKRNGSGTRPWVDEERGVTYATDGVIVVRFDYAVDRASPYPSYRTPIASLDGYLPTDEAIAKQRELGNVFDIAEKVEEPWFSCSGCCDGGGPLGCIETVYDGRGGHDDFWEETTVLTDTDGPTFNWRKLYLIAELLPGVEGYLEPIVCLQPGGGRSALLKFVFDGGRGALLSRTSTELEGQQ